jgi:hypothetical protein
LEYSKSKAKTNKKTTAINVNLNTMSLLEIRNISQKNNSNGSDLLSMLDEL